MTIFLGIITKPLARFVLLSFVRILLIILIKNTDYLLSRLKELYLIWVHADKSSWEQDVKQSKYLRFKNTRGDPRGDIEVLQKRITVKAIQIDNFTKKKSCKPKCMRAVRKK